MRVKSDATEQSAPLGDSTVTERTHPGLQAELESAAAASAALSSDPRVAASASSVLRAVETIESQLPTLVPFYGAVPDQTAQAFAALASAMSAEGLDGISGFYQTLAARRTALAIDAGSITAFGISIPGIALQLLLPLFALGVGLTSRRR